MWFCLSGDSRQARALCQGRGLFVSLLVPTGDCTQGQCITGKSIFLILKIRLKGMCQFVSVSIFSYFLRVLWYVSKCGCIHKLQRTTFDSILFPLWVPVIKFSTAQAALNQLTDSTYVYVWVGGGCTHTCVCPYPCGGQTWILLPW